MNKLITITCIILLIGCTSKQPNSATNPVKKTFTMVDVPAAILEPKERAIYLTKHYWDKFDFADTAFISLPEVTEQALANYIDLFTYVPAETASEAIKSMMRKAEADSAMFAHFCELYEKYLYDPNSPMRNEEYYIPVLESILVSNKVGDVEKIRPQHQLDLALKNRVGHPATDFAYTLPSGASNKLYSIPSEYTILFFYNPDCSTCKEVRENIIASATIQKLQKLKKIKILALYPDEDIAAWQKYIPNIPAEWINAYDNKQTIQEKEIYDLKAIPTLYLLDKDKKVLLKDVTFEQMEAFLASVQP